LLAILTVARWCLAPLPGGRFASDPGGARWCLAPIRRGDLLAILAGADGAWHRFRGAIC
jgi:hypothetical protein